MRHRAVDTTHQLDSHALYVHCDHTFSDFLLVFANTAQRWGRGLDLSYPKHLRVLR